VASRSPRELTWQNSILLTGDLSSEIAKLRQQPGRNIGVHGSATLVQYLLREKLLDELRLALFPVAAGTDAGQRLFELFAQPVRLTLADVKPTSTGVLLLTYRPLPPS
jgi:dihydrofolate reductase